MAVTTVTFYGRGITDAQGSYRADVLPEPIATNSYSPGETQLSDAAPAGATHARVATDTAIHVGHGATATADDPYLGAGRAALFGIREGGKLAIVAAA